MAMYAHLCECGREIWSEHDGNGEPTAFHVEDFHSPTVEEDEARQEVDKVESDPASSEAELMDAEDRLRGALDDSGLADREAVDELTFSTTLLCPCGKRYRALNQEPWIRLVEPWQEN